MPEQDNWKEEYLKRFLGMVADYEQEKELFNFISSLLSSQAHALKEQMKAKVTEMAEPYEGAKWHNKLTLRQILSAIESIEI